jgi:sugar phosphate isomerase/epimerase
MLKLGAMEHWFDGEPVVPGKTLAARLANLESWGYQGVQLGALTRGLGVPEIKQAFAQTSVRLLIHGRRAQLLAADPAIRQLAVEEISQGLREAAELDAVGAIVVPIRVQPDVAPPPPPSFGSRPMKTVIDLERELLIEGLSKIAPVAEEVGKPVILEPLNRYETHLLRTVGQAAEICRAVGSPGIKLMADFFHMNIEESDMGRAIEDVADCLVYVHLADSNRYQPGAGHLDFRPGLAALKRIGYDGYMTLECKILGEDQGQALIETARYIRSIWDEV